MTNREIPTMLTIKQVKDANTLGITQEEMLRRVGNVQKAKNVVRTWGGKVLVASALSAAVLNPNGAGDVVETVASTTKQAITDAVDRVHEGFYGPESNSTGQKGGPLPGSPEAGADSTAQKGGPLPESPETGQDIAVKGGGE